MFVPSLPSSNQSPLTRPTYRPVSSVWTGDLTYLPLIQSTVTTGGTERPESRDIKPLGQINKLLLRVQQVTSPGSDIFIYPDCPQEL